MCSLREKIIVSRHAAFASPPQIWSLVRQACTRDLTKDDDTKVFIIMLYKVSGTMNEKGKER